MQLTPWSDKDLIQLENLRKLLNTSIRWDINTPDVVRAYGTLAWLDSLPKKISDSIGTIESVKSLKNDENSAAPEEG